MGREKAKNAEQELAFQTIGQTQKDMATLDKLDSALESIITGEIRPNLSGTPHTTKLILRKWKHLDQHTPQLQDPNRISQEEAQALKQIMDEKPWAHRPKYGKKIQEIREQLQDHNQQTINATSVTVTVTTTHNNN